MLKNFTSLYPDTQYTYSDDERIEMVIHSAKANKVCGEVRKGFNLCRANLIGKYVDPNFCLEQSKNLINCFQGVRKDENPTDKENFEKVFQCGKKFQDSRFNFGGCQRELDQYVGK